MDAEFRVGSWLVQPSLNLISQNGRTVHLEPKVMEVLVCLSRRAGETVSKEELIQAVWQDTFVTDDVLKRCVSELRRVLEDDAHEPRFIETIPKRGYRLLIPTQRAEPPKSESGKAIGLVAKAVVAVALIIGATATVFYMRRTEVPIDSIAVMPFASKGADAGSELADGLTSGLIESLSQIPELRVMSRSSVTRYKGQEIDLRKVGRELNVRAVLVGTLAPRGDGFVLDAELVNTSDNSHLWGRQYTSTSADVLALQAELARTISTRLHPRLPAEAKAKLASPGTSNPEAYALYVKGRYAFDRWGAQHTKEALIYFQQAIEKDPTYAQAYAGVGDTYALLAYFGTFRFEENLQRAKAAARKALELDPNLAEGHCALGLADYIHNELVEAEGETRRCVGLNPNLSFAHQCHAWTLADLGQMEQSIAEEKLALQVDPLSHMSNKFLAIAYYHAHDYDRAIEQGRKMLEVEPDVPNLHDDLGAFYLLKGEYDKSALEYETAMTLEGRKDRAEALRRAYAKNGYRGMLKAQINFWNDPKRVDDYDPYSVAQNYALLGDLDNAFLWLDKAFGQSTLVDIKMDPQLDNIRSDPRYRALLRRVGLPQ
jgi:DNA-binding winged helix-turn-helix (wHTH) protein/TolB-like protein/Flp pilus assembly protein TadD